MFQLDEKAYFYSEDHDLHLYCADSLYLLKSFPSDSVDLIFADPPYFLSDCGISCKSGEMVSVNKGSWDRYVSLDFRYNFNLTWLTECQRVLKSTGSIFITSTFHSMYSIGFIMQSIGFKLLNDIIWYKVNPPPNLSCRYFTHSTESIIWASKNKNSKHYFNYDLMKSINDGKQMKNLWAITPPTIEEKRYGRHATQKPISLLYRILKAASKENDIVLDPFVGCGTSGVASVILNRRFIGIDKERNFLDVAISRLSDLNNEPKDNFIREIFTSKKHIGR